MSYAVCKQCGVEFKVKPSWVRRGAGKYCSRICAQQGRKMGRIVLCHLCGAEVYRKQQYLTKSQSGKFFCSRSCCITWQNTEFVREKHPNWKDGQSSYRLLLIKADVNMSCLLCGLSEKRVLLVHHVDRDRTNSSLQNLVWLCANCHFLVHHYEHEDSALRAKLS